jgi:hypothetical protein
MARLPNRFRRVCWIAIAGLLAALAASGGDSQLPPFGRDTVLVWKIQNQNLDWELVVRIAEFSPDRYVEWEDTSSQGTIFMPFKDVQAAKGFGSTDLFESGVDSKGKNATTLWLSQRIYRELKNQGKVKCELDGITNVMTYRGNDLLTVEVNRASIKLPVIKASDNQGSERWFLDREENPLMVRHFLRAFNQTLTSITTDRPNTLRWITGKKLANLPH